MKKLLFLPLLLLVLVLASCSNKNETDIVTTLFPHYDIAKNIAKDKLSVSIITPFGSEVHDFEPSPKQIDAINKAKLFIYTSDIFDTWVKGLIKEQANSLNVSDYITITSTDLATQIHYWTDPFVFIEMIDVITNRIIEIDTSNEAFYLTNATAYKEEILEIHEDLSSFLNNLNKDKTIYFAGHNALGGFKERYNLEIIALIDDFKPEADHTIKDIEKLINGIKSSNTKYLFVEELIEPKVAEVIKKELLKENITITLLELHGYHNITSKQNKENTTYATLFRQNYNHIKQAFN